MLDIPRIKCKVTILDVLVEGAHKVFCTPATDCVGMICSECLFDDSNTQEMREFITTNGQEFSDMIDWTANG